MSTPAPDLVLESDFSDIRQLPAIEGTTGDSTTATSPSPITETVDSEPEEIDEAGDNSFSIADSDSSDLAFHKMECKVDNLFNKFGPTALAIKIFLDKISSPIPNVSNADTYTLARLPGFSDNALWMHNKDRNHVKFRIIAELAQGDKYELNKVGPYLDMLYQSNGEEAKQKIVMQLLITPFDTLPEGVAIFEQAVERFNNVTTFTMVKRRSYFESQKPNNVRLYPGLAVIKGSEWVVRGCDSWQIATSTSVIFVNVPNGKDDGGPQAIMQENNLSLLGDYPDPDGHIWKLAWSYNLSKVCAKTPDVQNSHGTLLHPSEYKHYLIPGTRVADLVSGATGPQNDGRALAHPSRHCVTTALKIDIIPEYDEDIWDLIHRHEADKCIKAAWVREEECLAEEHHQSAKAEQAAKLAAAAKRSKNEETRKQERAEHLKSLWRMGSSSTSIDADTPRTAGSSTASMPSPSKCVPSKEPPTTPSPPKHQATSTAHGTTGGKPPRKVLPSPSAATKPNRTTQSKGKAKAQEPMDVDAQAAPKGKRNEGDSMDIDG
ncbi:hypothetical protein BT96DRAFT_991876 [Gymnopus androsaceus JB14]|uniref:Uncharacterized protein n=1 Tax=Gymnopus androsaceus JB14 TaxID=1447944 RepID=A0A6A4HUX8_9AGAR|nr:hypothetical protein BT96DRAFT_991876 [Gymnopus androsaceus JB14]